MSISSGDSVNKAGIKRADFEQTLRNQKVSDKKIQKALTIFDSYAAKTADGDNAVLDTMEQAMARAEFAQLDQSDNGSVSKKEFKHNAEGTSLQGSEYSVYEDFMKALNEATSAAPAEDQATAIVDDNNKDVTVVEGSATETMEDDAVLSYHVEKGTVYETEPQKPVPEANPIPQGETPQPVQQDKAFKDDASVKQAVYQYLLNSSTVTPEDIQRLNDMGVLNGLVISQVGEGGSDQVEIKFNGKTFILHKAGDNFSIDSKPEEGQTTGTTLQEEILNSQTTDVKHNYLNRDGKAGNSQSTYSAAGQGGITNTSNNRQHVNPVQTFTSMVLNNTEDSSLTINNGLKGQDVIDVINNGAGEAKTEISMNDLLKYLKAAIDEAKTTTTAGKNIGTRTAASDVDMDLKDLTNLGIVFQKYDADKSGGLNASELDQLIKDLTTKGNSMTKIAKGAKDKHHQYSKPEDPTPKPPTPPTPPKFEPKLGDKMHANRERYVAGSDKKESVQYYYDDGRRTLVKDGRAVENMNVAEYEDHGPLGIGKKDFVVIQGLPADVRAEIVEGKVNQDMVVEVKDKDGNINYYNVKYDAQNKTYSLGTNTMLTKLFGNDAKNMNIPKGLTMEYSKGKAEYKFNGKDISEAQARARIIAANPDAARPAADDPSVKQQGTPAPKPEGTPVGYPKGKKSGKLKENDAKDYIKNDPTHKELERQIAETKRQIAAIEKPFKERIEALKSDPRYKINESEDDDFTRDGKEQNLQFAITGIEADMRMATSVKVSELNRLTKAKGDFETTITNWENTSAPQVSKDGVTPAQVTLPDGMKAYRVADSYFALGSNGKPGKKFTADELKQHQVTDDYIQSQNNPVDKSKSGSTWFEVNPDADEFSQVAVTTFTRQNDNTIVATGYEYIEIHNNYKEVPVITTYQSDGKTKISEHFNNTSIRGYHSIPSERHFDASGSLTSITTDFSSDEADKVTGKIPFENITNSLSITAASKDVLFSTSEVKNKKGETVVSYNHQDKKYYDKDGNEITKEQAKEIIAKLDDKAVLVQNVKPKEQV